MTLAQKNFSDIITHTRASAGGRFNAQKKFEMVLANQWREDFDPVTGESLGMLIEEQRTNVLLNSANLSLMTLNTNATVQATPIAAPDGELAARVINMSGSAASGVYRSSVCTDTNRQTWSVFARQISGNGLVRLQLSGTAYTTTRAAEFDLITGEIVSTSGTNAFVSKITDDGWYRIAVSAPVDNAATPVHNVTIYSGDTTTKSVALWGGQLESGAFPTSYIPTTTAQVTRAADVATVNAISGLLNKTEGTLYAELIPATTVTAGIACFLTSSNNRIGLYRQSGNLLRWWNTPGTPNGSAEANPVTTPGNKTCKAALAFTSAGARALSVNGSAVQEATVTGGPTFTEFTALALMRSYGSTNEIMTGRLRQLRYYPSRLPNAQLQALTA